MISYDIQAASPKRSGWMSFAVLLLLVTSILTGPAGQGPAWRETQPEGLEFISVRSPKNFSPSALGQPGSTLKPFYSPAPTVTVSAGAVMLGETFTITATFENTGDGSGSGPTGYGPFIDLYIPHKGADGVYPNEATYDGISPASGLDYTASLDGENLTVITQTFPDDGGGSGCVAHPWGVDDFGIFLQVCGTAGDQLVSIELPYGSYTTGQARLSVSIPARLSLNANPGTTLTIRGRGGFIYGATPMVDWCCTDPPDTTLLSDSGAPSSWAPFSDLNPSVIEFTKTTSAQEVATGPNSPATFSIAVDLAPGQSFSDIDITDTLPNNLVYLGGLVTSPAADSIIQPAVDGLPHNGDTIQLHWDGPIDSSVVSTLSASFEYYVPELDASGSPIAPGTTTNQATLDQIIWTPADGSADQDLSGEVGIGSTSTSDQPLTLSKARAVAIESPPAGFTPGDVILYSLTFEISDYFGFDNLSLVDVLPDGQHYYTDATHYPTLSVSRDSVTESYDFDEDNIEIDCNYSGGPGSECDLDSGSGNPGETIISFDIDQELFDEGANTQLLGDLVDDGGSAANATVTGTIQFYAIMLDKYTDIHPAPNDYVKMGDSQSNSAAISGNQIDPGSCDPGPCAITGFISGNTAAADITVGSGTLDKSIVGLNGLFCNGGDPCASVSIAAGDTVTYRIQYDLLTGDYADLILTDFLPLPIFYAEDPLNEGSSLSSWPQDTDHAIPDPGKWRLGANDTRGHIPSTEVSPHTEDNYLRFVFGNFDDTTNTSKRIEILFTATVTDQRFGDGLKMRNSVLQQDANSSGETSTSNSNVDLILTEPVLVGEKSVVSTDHDGITPDPPIVPPLVFVAPGDPSNPPWNTGLPINSNYLDANDLSSEIDGIDGGDLVKFALVIENTGSGINGAYDIAIKDTLPAGYIFPSIGLGGFNLQVYRGDGVALDDGSGSGLEFLGISGDATDFFDNGIRLKDPEDNPAFDDTQPEYGQGLCQAHDSASGKNVIIITYDLQVDPAVSPGSVLQNVGEIINYSGEEGGDNYLPGPDVNPQDSTIDVPDLLKTRTGTGLIEDNNTDDQVVIGEEIYYELVITIPEGESPNTEITDTLDNGLRFISQDSFTVDSGDLSYTGSSVPVISPDGRTITWNLERVTNSNHDNSTAETITITYTVQTLNTLGNQHGVGVNNSVEISWDTLDSEGHTVRATEGPVSAADALIVEPHINVSKSVVVGGSGTTGDAGDSVLYTIQFTADPARPTAYEILFSDFLSPDIDFSSLPGYGISAVTDSAGVLTTDSFEITGSDELRLKPSVLPVDMAPGRSIEITLAGELLDSVYTGQVIGNDAVVTWSSQTGDHNSGAEDGERDGSDGLGGLNDYETTGTINVNVITPSPGKTVVSTSEAHSGTISSIPRLVIGEILRYRIEVRLAEGTNNDLILRDELPGGLIFLNDGTARVAFVADDTDDISSTTTADGDAPGITDAGAYFSGDQNTLSGITPTVVLPDANISRTLSGNDDTYGSGTDVYFKLGDVYNGEEDLNSEFAVVEFNVLVANLDFNQQGSSRYNRFSVYVDMNGDQNTDSGELIERSGWNRIILAEPTLQIIKSIDTAPHDAGDTIVYRLEIENLESGNNDATAFDLVLTDTFDSYLENLNVDSVDTTQTGLCLGNGLGTTAYSDDGGSFSDQDLTLTAACLDPGQSITLMISADLAYDVPAGYDLQNTGSVSWTSLPGEKGTAPNPTGSDVDDSSTAEDESGGSRGERNGSGSPTVNDYQASGFVRQNLDVPVPVKSIVSTSASHTSEAGDGSAGNPRDLAIGEIIRYRLAITLPEGTNTNLTLEDTLPAGFSYVGDSTVQIAIQVDQDLTQPADLVGANQDSTPPTFTLPAGRISVSGQQVTFDLGTLLNVDDDAGVEYVVIDFDVLVNNDANNDNTDLDNNDFEVFLDGSLVGTSNQVSTRIVEPVLEIQKTASTITPAYTETFTYTLDLTHAGGSLAEAFDIVVVDTIPAGLSYVPGSAGPGTWSPVFDGTDTLVWTCSSPCSLGLAGSASLTYDVSMASPPPPPAPGTNFENTAAVSWTSLDGLDSNQRTGDDNGGTEPYNDYHDSSQESVVLTNPDLTVTKTDGIDVDTYIPGAPVVYTIVVSNVGNEDVTDALVEDPLPLELNPPHNPMVSSWDWVCAGSTGSASGCTGSPGLAGDFSDLVDLPAGSSITYQVTANVLSSATGALENTVSVTMPGGVIEPTPEDNIATDSDGQDSHADLSVSKDDGITITSPGYAITYTVVVSNSSPSDVTGALVEDLIPGEIDSWTWDCSTISATGGATGCDGITNSTGNFNDTINLPAGSSITYLVTAQISAAASGSLTNTVTVAVPEGVEEDYPDDNTATDVDYFPSLTKTLDSARHGVATLPNVAIGEVVTYEITLSVPVGTMPNTHLVDRLDPGLAFVGCEPISGSGLATTLPTGFASICSSAVVTPSSGPVEDWGSQVDFNFGTLSNTSGGIIDLVVRYEVVVLDSLANQSDSTPPLDNNAEWVWDSGRLVAVPVAVTILEPDLTVTKSASPATLYPGQMTTFTLVVEHNPGSQTSAFDVVLTDILPDDLIYQPPIRHINGQVPTAIDESGAPTLVIEWDEFLNDGTNSVFEIDVMLDPDFKRRTVDQTITNEVTLSWTSLPIRSDLQQSNYNPLSTERYYDPLSNIDIYRAVDGAAVRIPRLPDTGFPPDRVTPLPAQSRGQQYGDLGGLHLEIPNLDLSLPIVSVPITDEGYDLTWLWDQAGWLEGTAYPTWTGNTVITGHAYLPSGLPGPFVNLRSLAWGDEILVYANGMRYTYQVRTKELVSADDLSILGHKDQDWLTLFTCQSYSEALAGYRWRQVVGAVLVEAERLH